MNKKIEVEKKYFCENTNRLIELIKLNGLKICDKQMETDEYFTDVNSEFIKNRTCLRLRKKDKKLELTFKGKSKKLTNTYAKIEEDINLDIKDYDRMASILNSLGYYSYVIARKNRTTYTKKCDDYDLNIMIDFIEEIGTFVEFELLCFKSTYNEQTLLKKLEEFIELFKELKLEEAKLPYRDFVAKKLYDKVKPSKPLKAILTDFDGTLVNTEKYFFESFKSVLEKDYGVQITYEEYKKYELDKNERLIEYLKEEGKLTKEYSKEDIMNAIYKKYEEKLQDTSINIEEMLNFKLLALLKKKNIKIGIVSTSKRKYINIMLDKLKLSNIFDVIISREDTALLKPDPSAYKKAMKILKINPSECLIVEDSKRGIEAAKSASVKVAQVTNFTENKESYTEQKIDKTSRLLFVLINSI